MRPATALSWVLLICAGCHPPRPPVAANVTTRKDEPTGRKPKLPKPPKPPKPSPADHTPPVTLEHGGEYAFFHYWTPYNSPSRDGLERAVKLGKSLHGQAVQVHFIAETEEVNQPEAKELFKSLGGDRSELEFVAPVAACERKKKAGLPCMRYPLSVLQSRGRALFTTTQTLTETETEKVLDCVRQNQGKQSRDRRCQ